MSTYDSGISTAAVEPSDLESYLKYNANTVAQYLWAINYFLTGNNYALVESPSLSTLFSNLLNVFDSSINGSVGYNIKSIYDFLDDVLNNNGTYLTSNGVVSSVYSNSISNFVRNGFLGLSTNIKAVTTAIQALNFNDYSSILSSIYSSVDGLESGLTSANTAIGGVTTAVNNVRTAVNNVVSGLSTVNMSVGTVNTSVGTVNSSIIQVDENLNNFYNHFISNFFNFSAGNIYLKDSGVLGSLSYSQPFLHTFRLGLVGLSRNIQGNSGTNSYTSTLNDNNNTTTTVNSTGLGPLLNTQLSNIGENLGHLAYIFASDDEIKLKQDSEPIMEEVGSIYDDSDSKVKVNADGIGGVKNVVGAFGDFLEVDAGIDDVITIVTNSQSYSWLTQETLNNLDSVGISTFSREESWHDKLYNKFYDEYFPERE